MAQPVAKVDVVPPRAWHRWLASMVLDAGGQLAATLGTLAALLAVVGPDELEPYRWRLVPVAAFLWCVAALARGLRLVTWAAGPVSPVALASAGMLLQVARVVVTVCALAGLVQAVLLVDVVPAAVLLAAATTVWLALPGLDLAGMAMAATGAEWHGLPQALGVALGPRGMLGLLGRALVSVTTMIASLGMLVALLADAPLVALLLLAGAWGLSLVGAKLRWKEHRRIARALMAGVGPS